MDKIYECMKEARVIAVECWRDKETENKAIDAVLVEAISKRIANWMQIAAQHSRNEEYYRGLLVKCGEIIGKRSFECDDGTISDDVLCAKIPEILETYVHDQ